MAKDSTNSNHGGAGKGGFSVRTLEVFYQKNKKAVFIGAAAIIVVAAGIFYYQTQIKGPKETQAATEMFKAEYYFGLDSFNLALKGRTGTASDFMGFESIIDEYGSTKAGNLSHYYAGVCNLHLGQFQDAIDHLKKFESNDVIIGSMALGCMGDAYRELNDSENAAKYYEKAAQNNNNTFTAPMYLKKAALTYEEDLKNYDKALDIYKKIQKEYGNTSEGRDISKYIARVETLTGK